MYRSRPYPKGCRGVASRAARLAPISNRTWLPESTTEWIASASIDEERLRAYATNLVAAIPRFADSAAMTALLLPPAATSSPHDRHYDRPNFPGIVGSTRRGGH